MKVGVFHPALYLNGGAELVALVVVNTLAQNGYKVILFTNKKVDQQETEKMLGEPIHSSVKTIVKPSLISPRTPLDVYHNVFRSIAFKKKCDILFDTYSNCFLPWTDIYYVHFPFVNQYLYAPRFPYLKSCHPSLVAGLPYVFMEKNILNHDPNGKLIIANSHFTANSIQQFSKADIHVLYPPIQSTLFNKNSVGTLRKNLVVTVSRFGFGKGLEIIPYIAKLTEDHIKFVIIGVVHDQCVLQSIRDSIAFLDVPHKVDVLTNVSKQQIKQILESAKIYFHPTVNEHFGISIAEAMAMGCIPVVHNSGGVKEFVPDNYRYNN
ncbi:MAG: glycosyltransferase, partial [Candidatus Bathyarchaeota archaeon]|nr:glycosyltransferase [Candidatus Bathyarchaeum sp.]